MGHFPIRRGKQLEDFLIKLCEIAGIRTPSIDRAIREAARYLRSWGGTQRYIQTTHIDVPWTLEHWGIDPLFCPSL
jgi:hypothetical protein